MKTTLFLFASITLLLFGCDSNMNREKSADGTSPDNLYQYNGNLEARWISFENHSGEKGRGGMENNGAKGHPSDVIPAGKTVTLADVSGPGIINRIWITISDRSPYTLRGLVLKMYWDNAEKPAVSVPFGDFFGVGLGYTATFQNALFANPEGRSFNSFIQMPFKQAAKIEIVNELPYDVGAIFYDVDLQLMKEWDDDNMYFHAHWHRDTSTTPGKDFELLPQTDGRGRFLGTNVSVNANPLYKDYWWGEGEVKVFLDGDDEFPTLVGTGTEDYIGSAWGQSKFFNKYTGCSVADPDKLQWSFYRFHIPDPVFFKTGCRVTIQQMGGSAKHNVIELQRNEVPLIPVTVGGAHVFYPDSTVSLEDSSLPGDNAWTNFYRSDDIAAVVYYYLDSPVDEAARIQSLKVRTADLRE